MSLQHTVTEKFSLPTHGGLNSGTNGLRALHFTPRPTSVLTEHFWDRFEYEDIVVCRMTHPCQTWCWVYLVNRTRQVLATTTWPINWSAKWKCLKLIWYDLPDILTIRSMLNQCRVFHVFNCPWDHCSPMPWFCSNMPSEFTFCHQKCRCIYGCAKDEEDLCEPHYGCGVGWSICHTDALLVPTLLVFIVANALIGSITSTTVVVVPAHLDQSIVRGVFSWSSIDASRI